MQACCAAFCIGGAAGVMDLKFATSLLQAQKRTSNPEATLETLIC
jgi:hypothetical protein